MPERATPRPLWSGTVSFGLVAIPVDLYPATRSAVSASLRMLAPDGTPLVREYVCPEHDRAVDRDELVRAYERDDGELVALTDAELEALAPEASRDIEIRRFFPRERLSPLLFDRPYFLLPSSDATKPYRLLARALAARERAGIASFVMRGHQRVIAIFAEHQLLHAQTLRFAAQLRTPATLGLPAAPPELDAEAVARWRARISAHTGTLEPDELEDQGRARLTALAEQKFAEGRDLVAAPDLVAGAEAAAESEVIDLMEVLKRSLARPEGRDSSEGPGSKVAG